MSTPSSEPSPSPSPSTSSGELPTSIPVVTMELMETSPGSPSVLVEVTRMVKTLPGTSRIPTEKEYEDMISLRTKERKDRSDNLFSKLTKVPTFATPAPKLDTNFICVETGYTSRIVDILGMSLCTLDKDGEIIRVEGVKESKINEDFKEKFEEIEEIFEDEMNSAYLIYDNLWGKGLYIRGNVDLKKNKDEIVRILTTLKGEDGYIVFHCKSSDRKIWHGPVLKLLKRLDYCACFAMETIMTSTPYLHDGKVFMTKYEIDAESG